MKFMPIDSPSKKLRSTKPLIEIGSLEIKIEFWGVVLMLLISVFCRQECLDWNKEMNLFENLCDQEDHHDSDY